MLSLVIRLISNLKDISNSLNNLLEEVVGKKEQNLVDTLTIRSMSKATYSTENIVTNGLAFDFIIVILLRQFVVIQDTWHTVCYNIT